MQQLNLTQLRQANIAESISMRNNIYTFRKTYYYTNGGSPEKFAESIKQRVLELSKNRLTIEVVETGNHWAPFKGGASIRNSSHWWVKCRLVDNTDKVQVISLMTKQPVMISACDVGTCLDPSQERYWSM